MECSNCCWWARIDDENAIVRNSGYCMRYPPVIVRADDSMEEFYEWYGEWPRTNQREWCGEFKEKKT